MAYLKKHTHVSRFHKSKKWPVKFARITRLPAIHPSMNRCTRAVSKLIGDEPIKELFDTDSQNGLRQSKKTHWVVSLDWLEGKSTGNHEFPHVYNIINPLILPPLNIISRLGMCIPVANQQFYVDMALFYPINYFDISWYIYNKPSSSTVPT